jgi:hypothetical protein
VRQQLRKGLAPAWLGKPREPNVTGRLIFLSIELSFFLYSFFWLSLDCLIFRRGFAGRAHAALPLLHGDVECGVDGEVELVGCGANMDRMASGPKRCQHQIDPGIDGE